MCSDTQLHWHVLVIYAPESAGQGCPHCSVFEKCKSCPVSVQLAAMSMSLIACYVHMSNAAGVNLLNESNLIAGILLNTMFLLGTFTFAVVLGVVSDDISSEVKVLDHHASQICATCCSHVWLCPLLPVLMLPVYALSVIKHVYSWCQWGIKSVHLKPLELTPKCVHIINCCRILAASGLMHHDMCSAHGGQCHHSHHWSMESCRVACLLY